MRRTIALAASIVLLAGCGGGSDEEDPASTPSGGGGGNGTQTASSGKQLFTEKCGSCHTLEDAGTGGTFGPNLDEVQPDKERVVAKIAQGGGGMPAKLYEGEDAETVATYVAQAAG
jgi:mono/diheme cytochrome c family protein